MAAHHRVEALLVDGAAGHEQREAAREFRQQSDVLRHIALRRAGRVFVGVNFLGADARDPARKFRIARRQHERMEPVREQIAQQPRAIRIIFAPAEIMVGIERHLFLDAIAHPLLPVQIVRCAPILDVIIPFALRIVAHVGVLPHHERTDLAGPDQLGGLVPARIRTNLRTDLEHAASLLDGIVNLESFLEITRHRLLAINMLAGFHRRDGTRGVPMIDRGGRRNR